MERRGANSLGAGCRWVGLNKHGQKKWLMGHEFAGVGLGGIVSALAGAKEVQKCQHSPEVFELTTAWV